METLQAIDRQIFILIHVHLKNIVLDVLCPILRDKRTWIPLYLFLMVLLFRKNKLRNAVYYIVSAVVLIAISDLMCAKVLKEIFQRIRPCHEPLLAGIVQPLVHCSDTYSLPSCHAMNHFSMAFFFILTQFKQLKWWLVLWATTVGFSQIYVGVHYPVDIAFGAIFGWGLGKTIQMIYEKIISYDVT